MSERNVCTEVVNRDLCSGCGVCAAICPQKTLSIQWNSHGEYVAVDQQSQCSTKCNLCLQVCPFAPDAENEDSIGKKLFSDIADIQHLSETGYYISSNVGYSDAHNHRLHGSSGGLATWTLETLLEKNLVDYAVCVSPHNERDKLFNYVVCSTPEQVRACSKSSYYPVELSGVVRHILFHEGRYAVVGLPCFIKALRLTMQKNALLRRRIKYLLGVVCGQQKGKFFAEYVVALKGENPKNLFSVHFREKDSGKPASEIGLRYACENGQGQRKEDVVFWSEGMGQAWCARYFTLNACNYCDDVFAELADVTFMDAWLPEYSSDWRGTSIVLVRNLDLQELIETGQTEKELFLEPLAINSVIQSQYGVIDNKRTILSKRLSWAAKHQQHVLLKRVQPSPVAFVDSLDLTIQNATMQQSKAIFLALKNKGNVTMHEFSRKMRKTALGYKFFSKIVRKLSRIKQRIAG